MGQQMLSLIVFVCKVLTLVLEETSTRFKWVFKYTSCDIFNKV